MQTKKKRIPVVCPHCNSTNTIVKRSDVIGDIRKVVLLCRSCNETFRIEKKFEGKRNYKNLLIEENAPVIKLLCMFTLKSSMWEEVKVNWLPHEKRLIDEFRIKRLEDFK